MPERSHENPASPAPADPIPAFASQEAGAAVAATPPPAGVPTGTGWRSPLVLLI